LRHNRLTVNSKWGQDVAIALGDYLYATAFELISACENMNILQCISSATKAMCEGELLQVCERDNLDLLKERYIIIVKKKTASLFAASCQSGVLISNPDYSLQTALKEYGLNIGIAFQIVDDYLDFVGEQQSLGKPPGQDIAAGEITLPILNLWESVSQKERDKFERILASKKDTEAFRAIKSRLINSGAVDKTKEAVFFFVNSAKEKINILFSSAYKDSLFSLADFIMERGFGVVSVKASIKMKKKEVLDGAGSIKEFASQY
jgi:geranylgeranyl pyrophosphate synthase